MCAGVVDVTGAAASEAEECGNKKAVGSGALRGLTLTVVVVDGALSEEVTVTGGGTVDGGAVKVEMTLSPGSWTTGGVVASCPSSAKLTVGEGALCEAGRASPVLVPSAGAGEPGLPGA